MGSNYIFSLEPTFTQGLVLGQLSVLVLLVIILKYIFLDSTKTPLDTFSYHPRAEVSLQSPSLESHKDEVHLHAHDLEPAEWLNFLLQQVADVYRSKLRDDLPGLEGDEVVRTRIENYANKIRPPGFLDHIRVHSVDLGTSAPRILNAQLGQHGDLTETTFETSYKDTLSISLSTAYLFNYPMSSFARLPVSLTISLSMFKSFIRILPPAPNAVTPAVTFGIAPDFTLDLNTTSLMGSRAKLANVPKLHELIQHQVRRVLITRGTWKVVLPGMSTMSEINHPIKKEHP